MCYGMYPRKNLGLQAFGQRKNLLGQFINLYNLVAGYIASEHGVRRYVQNCHNFNQTVYTRKFDAPFNGGQKVRGKADGFGELFLPHPALYAEKLNSAADFIVVFFSSLFHRQKNKNSARQNSENLKVSC